MPAYYAESLANFIVADPNAVVGSLAQGATKFAQNYNQQIKAWSSEVMLLRGCAEDLALRYLPSRKWAILLEYPIPRRDKRVDAIILADGVIFVIECKIGGDRYDASAKRQAEDYALDLRDFHAQSRNCIVVPMLLAPEAESVRLTDGGADMVKTVVCVNRNDLVSILLRLCESHCDATKHFVDVTEWDHSQYYPVPTILEAAQALYAKKDVREITSCHAHASNLSSTSDRLVEILEKARVDKKKMICFVTGVPGAGKTLAGLNAVHNPTFQHKADSPGVFLSGNGPLVRIVSEALALDRKAREGLPLSRCRRDTRTFIQNVHSFIDTYYGNSSIPPEHAVVFDEAQRAWNHKKSQVKFGRSESEAELMLSIMDRYDDWAVIVCLVGTGQEIHDGEAGLEEWGTVVADRYPHWEIHAPEQAMKEDSNVLNSLFPSGIPTQVQTYVESLLHLPVSIRSFRARQVSNWAGAVITGDSQEASALARETEDFPIVLTRSLDALRDYVREYTRGSRRCGLVASSGARRLRAYGLEVDSSFRRDYPYERWFLDDRNDVRSSYQLEVVATEFECQGLELDVVGLCWCNDFFWDGGRWRHRTFSGPKWQTIRSESECRYLENKYRVLLTRAREKTVIWVPEGRIEDSTLGPYEFDRTADFLLSCGLGSL